MNEPMSRIVVENESDWIRVKDTVSKSMMQVMELRLATLPGGKDGETAKRVRGEVERRVMKVSYHGLLVR